MLGGDNEDEQQYLGYVLKREGQRERSGTGVIFSHQGVDFHCKTTKRTKDSSLYLQCKTKNCIVGLISGQDYYEFGVNEMGQSGLVW